MVGLHNITGEFTYLIDDQDVKSQSIPAFFQINAYDLESAIENNTIGKSEEDEEEIADNALWREENLNPKHESDVQNLGKTESELIEQAEATGISGMEDESIKRTSAESTRVFDALPETKETGNEESIHSGQDTELQQDNSIFANADEGISYRVQICATRKIAESTYFEKNKNFRAQVTIENHEGWYKYTTGSFEVYQSARNSREAINQRFEFDGPFVAAYNDGDRISVQEALMISNQQWFK